MSKRFIIPVVILAALAPVLALAYDWENYGGMKNFHIDEPVYQNSSTTITWEWNDAWPTEEGQPTDGRYFFLAYDNQNDTGDEPCFAEDSGRDAVSPWHDYYESKTGSWTFNSLSAGTSSIKFCIDPTTSTPANGTNNGDLYFSVSSESPPPVLPATSTGAYICSVASSSLPFAITPSSTFTFSCQLTGNIDPFAPQRRPNLTLGLTNLLSGAGVLVALKKK